MEKQKTYIAIDLKSFYASVECVDRGLDPLTTNLLVADVSKTEKTICLAVTPSLKAHGISGRVRLFEAIQQVNIVNAQRKARLRGKEFTGSSYDDTELQKNPSLAVDYIAAPPRMALYREISAKIVAVYLKYVSIDDLYPYSIDEVFIDATHYLDTYKIIPPDKDGVRIAQLDMMTYRRTLWTHKDLTDFWMVGSATARRLNKLGLYTMGDVAWCSIHNEDRLYKEFGKNAVYLIDQAWGRELVDIPTIKKYQPESTSTSSGQVLTRPYTYDETRIIIMEMVDKLVLELFEKGLTTDQIVLDVGYDIENLTDPKRRAEYKGEIVRDRYGREIPKHAGSRISLGKHTSSTKLITSKTLELFERIVDKKLLTRRLTITANHLLSVEEAKASEVAEQLTLFDTTEDVAKKEADEDREKRMQRAMLDIKTRFGPNAVMKGTSYLDAATGIERNEPIGGHKA